jgi:hypothetical protein
MGAAEIESPRLVTNPAKASRPLVENRPRMITWSQDTLGSILVGLIIHLFDL